MHYDPILLRQLPYIAKIIEDETWLEGERRRCMVPPHDPVVQANVCEVVLRIGGALRAELSREAYDTVGAETMDRRAA